MERISTNSMIVDFANALRMDEKSNNTIQKYLRDVRAFVMFSEDREISKELVVKFKTSLTRNYEVTSANSIIASLNAFLRFLGWGIVALSSSRYRKRLFSLKKKK